MERVSSTLEALQKNEFITHYMPDRLMAKELVLSLISEGASVGVGGSITIRNLDLEKELRAKGHPVYDHWENSDDLTGCCLNQRTCDVFLCSTNALTIDGQLVNLDGSGNRVSSMIFGPRRVIVVAGINKLVSSVELGMERARNIVAPELYRRKGISTPCAKLGHCTKCRPPIKQCRVLSIIEAKPKINLDFHVILVGECLGI